MNINLETQWEAFIDENLKSGRYISASEIVHEGLRLLQEKEQLRQLRLDGLRKEVDKGLNALGRGEHLELDEQEMKDYLEGVEKRGRERLAKKNTAARK